MRPLVLFGLLQVIFLWRTCVSLSCDVPPKNTEARLQHQILCGYDKSLRPVGDSKSNITIRVKMFLKSFDYDDAEGKITINSWLSLRWKDEHLKWNTQDFDNMDSVTIHSDEIWMPDLTLYNSKSTQYTETCNPANCIVYNSGMVSCIPPCSHEAICKSDYTYWPFDTQNCSLHLGSWVHKGEEVGYELLRSGIEKSNIMHKEWKMISTFVKKIPGNYSCCPDETYPSLHFSFVIERHSASEQAFILAPAFILVTLNLLTLWLNPLCSERLIMCIVSIFSHFIFIQQLSWLVPKNGNIAPNAILFFRDSLIISAVLICHALVMRGLMACQSSTPTWIKTFTETIRKNKISSAVFSKPYLINSTPLNNESGNDDSSNLIESGNVQQADETAEKIDDKTIWITAVRIFDILFFVILFIVYFFMFIGWIPSHYKYVDNINADIIDEEDA